MTSVPAPRRDPADRRAQLLEVAIALAEADGLDQLGAADVASRAGASKPLVFHYFSTATGLRAAVAVSAVEDARAALGEEPGGVHPADPAQAAARLTTFLDAVLARRRTWEGIWQGALAGDPETEAALARVREGLVQRLTAGLGGPLPDGSPRALLLTEGWVALAEHLVATWLAGRTTATRQEVEALVLETFQALVVALSRPAG
ncbi:MAG: TetR/AcrR family transcriptional regulator [Promicromonosporaceae bacterium]|nr:TetR/AcrR family transcriptional regulator [Promicromonosporaceae bacterium]